MRYHFDVTLDGTEHADDFGVDLASSEDAEEEAVEIAFALVRERRESHATHQMVVAVRSEAHERVCEVRVSMSIPCGADRPLPSPAAGLVSPPQSRPADPASDPTRSGAPA